MGTRSNLSALQPRTLITARPELAWQSDKEILMTIKRRGMRPEDVRQKGEEAKAPSNLSVQAHFGLGGVARRHLSGDIC